MASSVRRTAARCALPAALLVLCSACTDTTRPALEDTPRPAPATSTGPVRPDPDYEHPHPASDAARATFPAPGDLGPGWGYARSTADEEPPNGVPAFDANVEDTIDASIPEGCLRLNPLPLPSTAVTVRYTYRGAPVTASQVGFDSRAVAGAFFSLLVANLEDCTDERGDHGERLVGRVTTPRDGITLADRYPDDAFERTSLAIRGGTSVLLLQAPVALGTEPFTPRHSVAIARVFRRTAP